MNVLYLDLNPEDVIEDYSQNADKVGGGSIVASALMPYLNDNGHYMEIWADNKSFEHVPAKYKKYCKELSYVDKESLKDGSPLLNWSSDFDIVLHNFPTVKVNCDGIKTKDVVWIVGYGERVHPNNLNIIIYNEFQEPKISNPKTEVHYAVVGIPIPKFKIYKKEAIIFSCHRQSIEFGAKTMMEYAHKYQFKYIAAGCRDASFPNLMDYVDNKMVKYLGIIDNKTKINYLQRAMCTTHLHTWNTPFNLSACESLAYGTPIISSTKGFWPSLVKIHRNGFTADNEREFIIALSNIALISQKECYNSIEMFSTQNMIDDYLAVFKDILR